MLPLGCLPLWGREGITLHLGKRENPKPWKKIGVVNFWGYFKNLRHHRIGNQREQECKEQHGKRERGNKYEHCIDRTRQL